MVVSRVPSRFRIKFSYRHRSDPYDFVLSTLKNFKVGFSAAVIKERFQLIKYFSASAYYKFRGVYPRPINRRRRGLLSFFYSYRFPRFMGQRRSRPTLYSKTLSIKQQLKKFYYYFKERQFSKFVKFASVGYLSRVKRKAYAGNMSPNARRVFSALEYRLATVLRRSYFYNSVFEIRQSIVHGHVYVNGVKAFSPNQILSLGDFVSFSSFERERVRKRVASYFRVLRWVSKRRTKKLWDIDRRIESIVVSKRTLKKLGRLLFERDKLRAEQRVKGRSRRFTKTALPHHLDVNFSLLSVSLISPVKYSTLFFPTLSKNIETLPGFYRA